MSQEGDPRASDHLILRSTRRLDEIPRNFFDIGNALSIKSLDLSCNSIKHIPNEIRCLHNLVTMDASHNQLSSLPSELAGLKELKSLDVSFNRISKIAAEPLAFCASLSTVRLAGNGLKQLHCSVAVLPSLSLLDVSQNNAIVIYTQSSQQCDDPVSQPPTKAKSGNLGVLDNFRTRRERGSAEDDQVKRGTRSEDGGEQSGREGMAGRGLKSLLAGCCGGALVVEGMSSWALTGLSILSLHLNRLSQAPLVPCMTALRRLVLDSNCISTLPDMVSTLQSLENLFVANNLLTDVPASLSSLSSLVNVDMCFNSIKEEGLSSAVSTIIQANHGLQSFLLYGNPIARDCLENGTRQRETQDGSRRKKSDERESEGGFRAATCLFSETDSYLSPAYGVAMSKEDQRKRQLGDRLSTTTTPTESAMKELLREMTALILAGSYQAALLLLYDRVFRQEMEIPAGISLMLRAVPVLTGADGQACGGHCWAATHRASPQIVLVQVREALLIRGPFALIVLTLGHELVHVRQMLGAELKGQAEREFEAFSWMLIEGTRYPPLVHEDRIWILQKAERWYTSMNSETRRRHAAGRQAMLRCEERSPLVITH